MRLAEPVLTLNFRAPASTVLTTDRVEQESMCWSQTPLFPLRNQFKGSSCHIPAGDVQIPPCHFGFHPNTLTGKSSPGIFRPLIERIKCCLRPEEGKSTPNEDPKRDENPNHKLNSNPYPKPSAKPTLAAPPAATPTHAPKPTMVRPSEYVRLCGTVEELSKQLGPLACLLGKWVGMKGWNLVAMPGEGSTPAGGPFKVLLQQYTETINFSPIGAPVRNRGGSVDQFISGLLYEITINDNNTGEVLHVENGMFLNLKSVVNNDGSKGEAPPFELARTANIPHGNTCLILGDSVCEVVPTFDVVSALPPDLGPYMPSRYLQPYEDAARGKNFDVKDVNKTLREDICNQDIIKTTTLHMTSKNAGGILNVPFIEKFADATRFDATFWIETVRRENGTTFEQLQYSQITDLAFFPKAGAEGLIQWPHPNVNTLIKI